MQGSTSVFTSWPTHGDTELMEWLLFLLTHAAWYPVLSGEHLSGEASGHQASTFQRMGLHGPASLSPEHWASSSPSKARGPSHRLKLGNSCLALPLGSLGKRYRLEADHPEATPGSMPLSQRPGIRSYCPCRGARQLAKKQLV